MKQLDTVGLSQSHSPMPSPQDESPLVPSVPARPSAGIPLLSPPAAAGGVAHASPPVLAFLDRDHSILSFNERVLDWAYRAEVPLLERLRYLCIVSSNLDEWFEVRSAPHVAVAQTGEERDSYTRTRFAALMDKAQALVAQQYQIYNQALIPAFHTHGIRLISHGERNAAHDFYCREELDGWLASGELARLDLAFSRDQAAKVYVQDRLRMAAEHLRSWVAEGAAIYVCGSLDGMGRGGDAVLRGVLGAAQVEVLIEEGRYRRDVY